MVSERIGKTYGVFVDGKPVGLVGSTTRTLEQRRRNGYVKRFGPSVELRLIREIPRPEDYSNSDYNFYLKACEAMDIGREKTYTEHGGLNKISPLIQALGHPVLESEMGRLGSYEDKVRAGRLGSHEDKVRAGSIAGRTAVESGQLAHIRNLPQTKDAQRKAGRIAGYKSVENGRLAGMASLAGRVGARNQPREAKVRGGLIGGRLGSHEDKVRAGSIAGRIAKENGHIQALGRKYGCINGRKNAENGHCAKISAKALCQRWNINHNKPCTCGKHLKGEFL